jgi:hypothetical protein
MNDQNNNKHLLVLARNEPVEAMRVAAGLTIVGHSVGLVFMNRALTHEEAQSEHGELLELCDIEPVTTVPEMQEHFALLSPQALAEKITEADVVLNL